MRFILQDDVSENLPSDWDDKVTKAKAYVEQKVAEARATAIAAGKPVDEIEALCVDARHKAINAKSDIWHFAGEALWLASNGKCWYCESRQDRSDKAVDHFRPKNSVNEATANHPGYWWLAFDWKNYRYSCTYCNSKRRDIVGGTDGGKHDHFPIIEPPPHARSETDPPDNAKLLDPTDDDDTKLLTFLTNGFPSPAKGDALVIDRVKESVKLYHLDHRFIVRRRKRLADDIWKHVTLAERARDTDDRANYMYHKHELIKCVRANAEYSSAARVYLQAYRTHEWVQEILDRDL